VSERGVV